MRRLGYKKRFVVMIAVALACIAVCLFLFMKRDSPVVLELNTDVGADHDFQILNPFRDRGPERVATSFLEQLKAGQCSSAFRGLGIKESSIESSCAKEREYPIRGLRLEARGRDGGKEILRYRVQRVSKGETFDDPFWIWVTEAADGWKVTACDKWY